MAHGVRQHQVRSWGKRANGCMGRGALSAHRNTRLWLSLPGPAPPRPSTLHTDKKAKQEKRVCRELAPPGPQPHPTRCHVREDGAQIFVLTCIVKESSYTSVDFIAQNSLVLYSTWLSNGAIEQCTVLKKVIHSTLMYRRVQYSTVPGSPVGPVGITGRFWGRPTFPFCFPLHKKRWTQRPPAWLVSIAAGT